MKIFITGATGYVGHSLALTLANKGNQVNILVRNPGSVKVPVHENMHVFKGDISNRTSIRKAMEGCSYVYHTAALVKLWAKDATEFYRTNVEGTNNVLAEALEANIKKLVFTSTCGVIGASLKEPLTENDPRIATFDNDYEFTKFMAENLVKQYIHKGLFTVIVSLSKVFGPGIETHPVSVNKMIKDFIDGKTTFIPSPGTYVSNFCFIDDVVKGHQLAMEKGLAGEKYILGGENISYAAFFETLRGISKSKSKVIPTPKPLAKMVAWMQWLKHTITNEDLFFTARGLNHIYCNKSFSSSKAMQQLGYAPTALPNALEKTIQFLNLQNHAH